MTIREPANPDFAMPESTTDFGYITESLRATIMRGDIVEAMHACDQLKAGLESDLEMLGMEEDEGGYATSCGVKEDELLAGEAALDACRKALLDSRPAEALAILERESFARNKGDIQLAYDTAMGKPAP